MGIKSDWEKWSRTGKAPWEWTDYTRKVGDAIRKDNINDNIRKATTRAGTMFAKPTTLGEQAAGYLKTALPNFGGRALGFMASPWAPALGGIFAPTPMGNSEFIGSPEHQQWLARRGPLAKR